MKFLLAVLLAALSGTAVAWAVIDRKYGQSDVDFGVMDMEGNVTAEGIEDAVNLAPATAFAEVELPDGDEHDFGVMRVGQQGEHQFRIRNAGTRPLTLRLGTTSCKCTLGNLVDDQLPPGKETTVEMEWTVKTGGSEFSQTAELRTNDPETPAVQLTIRGDVIGGVEIVPKSWAFGDVAAGESIEMSAKVFNHLEHEIEPTELSFSNRSMRELAEIEVEPFTPSADDGIHANARQGFRITARVPPGMPQGAVEGSFQFGYDVLGEPEKASDASASVSGRVVGVLGMIPSTKLKEVKEGTYLLDLGRMESDGEYEARALVVVKGREHNQIQLRVGDVEPEGVLDVSLGEPRARASTALYRLHIRFVPGAEPIEMLGNGDDDFGQIMIEAADSDIPPMRLLLTFALPAE